MNPHYQYFLAANGEMALKGDSTSPKIKPVLTSPIETDPKPVLTSPVNTDPIEDMESEVSKNPPETSPTYSTRPLQVETNIYTQPVDPIQDVLADIENIKAPSLGGGGGGGMPSGENGQPAPPTRTWLPLILIAVGTFLIIKRKK